MQVALVRRQMRMTAAGLPPCLNSHPEMLAIVMVEPSEVYADGVRAAVAQLLSACPELHVEWQQMRLDYDDDEDAAYVGLYNIIAQVVKPQLGRALGLPADLLQEHDHWRELLTPVTDEPNDLARRMYEVLDLWATSSSTGVVEGVGVEFGGGWGGWTPDVTLYGPAGPALRRLVGPGSPYIE